VTTGTTSGATTGATTGGTSAGTTGVSPTQAGFQNSPQTNTNVAGVQNLPSTSTESHDTSPLVFFGLVLMAVGGGLLRWKPASRMN